MNKTKIKVDVVSDVVCPWCYIGKRRLEKAMQQLSDKFDFEVEYHPFELNPAMPSAGAHQKEYLTRKFGSVQRYDQITQHVTNVASGEGLQFDFASQTVSPNTRPLHAIISYAKTLGKQLETKEAFLKAYFINGVDLSKLENILKVTAPIGLDNEKVRALIGDTQVLNKIAEAENHLQKLGISGVPFYIINNQHGLSGAQPTEVFVNVFEELHLKTTSTGDTCDVDSKDC